MARLPLCGQRERNHVFPGEELTPDFVAACVREIIDDDTVPLNEVISDGAAVTRQIPRTKPGTYFFSGGSSRWFGEPRWE